MGSLLPCFKALREIALLHKTVGKIKIPGKADGKRTSRGCKTVSARHRQQRRLWHILKQLLPDKGCHWTPSQSGCLESLLKRDNN